MNADAMRERLLDAFPGAQIEINDLTGGGDHWDVTVVSDAFEGKRLIQQHQMVYAVFQDELNSGELHALKLSTRTPRD